MHVGLLVVAVVSVALPTQVTVKSRVGEVTVFQGTAKVTRVAHVELAPGDTELVFPDLPASLQDDSLTTDGSGTARAHVFGAQVEQVSHSEVVSPEARAAQTRVQELEDKDRSLVDQLQTAQARRTFVDSLRATYSQERNQNLPSRPVETKELTAMADFVARQTDVVSEQIRKTELRRRELAQQLRAAREELQKLSAKIGHVSKSVTISMRVHQAGSFDLRVSYLVAGASWSPVWDARLDAAKSSVELGMSGVVAQSTGEDWNDVKVALSTAQPTRALYVPELSPRYLDAQQPPPQPKRRSRSYAGAEAPSAARSVASLASADSEEEAGEARPALPLEQATATVQEGLLSTSYVTPRRESILGNGRARKAFLQSVTLKASVTRLTAPSLDPQVYLTAKARNESAAVLLGGPVNVFLGEEFLGKTQLPLVPPGDDVKLAFGADPRVKVERRLVERKHETSGLFNKDEVDRYHFRIHVKNLYGQKTRVDVLEQVPVSRDTLIQVKVLEGSTAPSVPEEATKPGVRTYQVSLEPGVEKELDLIYEVRAPSGTEVAGRTY